MRFVASYQADAVDAPIITSTIVSAFHDLAVTRWLVEHPIERRRAFHNYIRIHVEHALAHGKVWGTLNRAGVAVWFGNDKPMPEITDYDRRLAAACGEHLERFQILDELLAKHHPHEAHHHLAFLAVGPAHQGQGIGSALMDEHHVHLDQLGMPAYLEAACPRSRELYLSHGYQDHGDPIVLPDGPTMWPMWRPPDTDRTWPPFV
jgi:GNAT superfamily N-acetyltransferase